MAVNFSVKTQAAAYREGFQDALALLVTALEEGGDVNYLLEALDNNADAPTRARLDAYYDAKNGR